MNNVRRVKNHAWWELFVDSAGEEESICRHHQAVKLGCEIGVGVDYVFLIWKGGVLLYMFWGCQFLESGEQGLEWDECMKTKKVMGNMLGQVFGNDDHDQFS